MQTITEQAASLRQAWATDPRWSGIRRDYTAEEVIRRRGPASGEHTAGEHTAARRGARRLWEQLRSGGVVRAPGTVAIPGPAAAQDACTLMQSMIAAGAAGVLFDDLLAPQSACGQVLVPTGQQIATLNAARFGADVLDVPALVIARTHAHSACLLTSDADESDHEFLTGERTAEGLYRVRPGRYARITRALAFAPYADLLWLETPAPSLAEARAFATLIYSQYPDKLLAYGCSPSFRWPAHLDDTAIAEFQRELAALGYRFQFVPAPAGTCPPPRPDRERTPLAAGSAR